MLINEITSAEDQLALLRLIIDNTWVAIRQEAEAQARSKAAKNRASKLKPKAAARAGQLAQKTVTPNTLPAFTPPPAKQAQVQAQAQAQTAKPQLPAPAQQPVMQQAQPLQQTKPVQQPQMGLGLKKIWA